MAQVFAKIFQNKKYQNLGQIGRQQSKSNTTWHVTQFSKEDINLVLFKDCAGGKQPILDSRCIRKVTLDDILCEKCRKQRHCYHRRLCRGRTCPNCPGLGAAEKSTMPKYKNVCSSNKNDVNLVGEMIFGTAPLASSGTTVKVHSLKNPHQLMLSTVFQYKKCKDQTPNDFDSLDSFESSMYGDGLPRRNSENNLSSIGSHAPASRPMDMPSLDDNYYGSDTSLNISVASGSSLRTPIPSPGANSSASINSGSRLNMMRRMRRSFNCSLQYNTGTTSAASTASGPSSSSCESPQPSLSDCGSVSSGRRRGPRIGMAVIFTLDEFDDSRRQFESFFFSNITLIEGRLFALCAAVEKGACEPKVTECIMEALDEFKDKVYDLYTAPRLSSPVWLSMMASTTKRYQVCEGFVQQFTTLIERYDTKSTNYFVSTMLTGVLMYHLAWVPTVTPSGENHSTYSDKHSAKWLAMLAKSHPYNPLWAQLSDMYGAIGMPPRLARTIVAGKKVDTIVKFLFVLSYFIRCSEIHETLDECYDEEYLVEQLKSAADDICLESMEKDAVRDEFVLVDPPNATSCTQDVGGESDSGLATHYTGQSKGRQLSGCGSRRLHSTATTTGDSESGFNEHTGRGTLAHVRSVPASSPSDKVIQWINTSHLNDTPSAASSTVDVRRSTTDIHRSATDIHLSTNDIHRSAADIHRSTNDIRRTSADIHRTSADKHRSFTGMHSSATDLRRSTTDMHRSTTGMHRSTTDSTLISSSTNTNSPVRSPCSMSPKQVQCLPPPQEARVEVVLPVHRSAVPPTALPGSIESGARAKMLPDTSKPATPAPSAFRKTIVRLFSSEIDDFDDCFDGKPPSFSRQTSSASQFDELFDDEDLDSCSMIQQMEQSTESEGGTPEPATPTNNRNMLFKVIKQPGFKQNPPPSQESDSAAGKQPACRSGSNGASATSAALSPTGTGEEQFRPRNLSIGRQSSRCSTPQTILGGGTTTPCSDTRCRHLSVCPTTVEDETEELKIFHCYDEITMPRSKDISKLADTAISTASFGRQQFASFSDHYLSDFVLQGTSDEDVFTKVQKDLVASVEHSVLEDRISEAVCVVADTERWTVNVCSSMREQPKPLAASHLVMSMVETVSSLAKLRMSPEFILMHMEDRLQEMFFKSRMLSEYIRSRKTVDMDELNAMFGMDVSDLRFLLSVAATHSTVNVHGIY